MMMTHNLFLESFIKVCIAFSDDYSPSASQSALRGAGAARAAECERRRDSPEYGLRL
jgi:hypothetical protein